MADAGWNWAVLTDEQIHQLEDAEQDINADYLLAYEPSERNYLRGMRASLLDLEVAALGERQLERLKALEAQLGLVLVAYQQGQPLAS